MKAILISFENTNALKRWVLSLDEHLREINLTNPPRQPRSVFWRSNRGSATYEPLASDSIFRRFDEYPNGVLLNLVDRDGGECRDSEDLRSNAGYRREGLPSPWSSRTYTARGTLQCP